jgi:hypothetical protein
MGEAKLKRRAHAKILEKYPWCIYCGGVHPADTIEHMPPISMFDRRQRPKGLEFPTCLGCNNGTRLSDLVASVLGRAYPNALPEDLQNLLKGVSNNVPGLLEEMRPPQLGSTALRVNGPILTRHVDIFGAKLGLALHYEAHGSPVPPGGGVQTMFFTNVSAIKGELPTQIIEMLPAPRTLKQGTREVSDQFQYSWALTEERRHSIFYATFRLAFSVAAVTALDRSEFLERHSEKYRVTVPGAFKKDLSANPPPPPASPPAPSGSSP